MSPELRGFPIPPSLEHSRVSRHSGAKMHLLSSISVVVAALSIAAALPQVDVLSQRTSGNKKGCKPFSGNFTIEQYQLYPENADFDFISCLLYIG